MNAQILVAEDNEDNMMVATMILERMGFTVLQAINGLEAYDTAVEKQPDLILMDHHMPEMTGIEATQALRVSSETKSIPIIALTADIDSKDDLLEAGCNAFLAKPLRSSKLLRIVHQVLSVG